MEGWQYIAATIAIQALGLAFHYGTTSRTSKEHERRIGVLEPAVQDHGQKLAAIEAVCPKLDCPMPMHRG